MTRCGRTLVRALVTGAVLALAAVAPAGSPGTGGGQLWTARYDGRGLADEAFALAGSPDGSRVFVTGWSKGTIPNSFEYATVAYDEATGARLWARRYGGPSKLRNFARADAVSPDGTKVFVTGASSQCFQTSRRRLSSSVSHVAIGGKCAGGQPGHEIGRVTGS